ncbi:MAG TPA: PhzF family phenazine biosynthesis protein [Puia sp.]|jgi:PhzF family phenazine biosynthesis protein|nr:PhzF family phenazine biosynthesis protein [Puia sp.]
MKLNVYVVNAFAETTFGGNPAAVVPLEQWLNDELLQQIAAQHNLAETAFIVPAGDDFAIRWMTPAVEVKLCGHATLASAHIYFNRLKYEKEKITFNSKSGPLHVTKSDDEKLTLDFPVDKLEEIKNTAEIEKALNIKPLAVYKSSFDYMVIANNQSEIESLSPDLNILKKFPSRGTIVTAKGDDVDFVSRCFFPQSGIDEDPVTGSAHTAMTPYWANKLGKTKLSAIQLSKRKGYLDCELVGDRVLISGSAITYLEGEIFI